MYLGDVGQSCYEEVDYQAGTSAGGENYGWNTMEGYHGLNQVNYDICDQPIITPTGITRPILEYSHDNLLAAVVGGYVYRGTRYPQMAGAYFFADYVRGLVWSLEQSSPGNWIRFQQLDLSPKNVSSFGEDPAGELYLTTYGDGEVYRIVVGGARIYLPAVLKNP
jgi:hypothetical protein